MVAAGIMQQPASAQTPPLHLTPRTMQISTRRIKPRMKRITREKSRRLHPKHPLSKHTSNLGSMQGEAELTLTSAKPGTWNEIATVQAQPQHLTVSAANCLRKLHSLSPGSTQGEAELTLTSAKPGPWNRTPAVQNRRQRKAAAQTATHHRQQQAQ